MRSVEDVDVMDEGYCDEFLDSISVNKSGKFQYRPQVMNGRWKVGVGLTYCWTLKAGSIC